MTQSATTYNQLMEDNDLVTLYVSINELKPTGKWLGISSNFTTVALKSGLAKT